MTVAIGVPVLILTASVLLAWPLGRYMQWVMAPPHMGPRRQAYESGCTRLLGPIAQNEQEWQAYCVSMLTFNLLMFGFVYVVLTIQGVHPLNPDSKTAMEANLAFHTSASFTSNTNLQHYSGEVALSYFSQLFGIMWLQFVSAATGIAALTALCRALGTS